MQFIKTALKILGVGIVLALGGSVGVFVAIKVLWKHDATYIQQGMAAFTGAAAVFVFTLIGGWLKQFRERRLKSHNALVRVEYLLNSYLNVVGDNRMLANEAQKSFKDCVFHVLNFKSYDIDNEILLSFRNMDFINEYFELTTDLRRHNESYKTIVTMYSDLKDAVLQKVLSDEAVKINFVMLQRHFSYP